jgi:uncharacterized protein YjbJ (UPF0337 family)
MNWNVIEGKWDQMRGKMRAQWGKLTDDDMDLIAGRRDQLIGKLKERYGYDQERAEKELEQFSKTLH